MCPKTPNVERSKFQLKPFCLGHLGRGQVGSFQNYTWQKCGKDCSGEVWNSRKMPKRTKDRTSTYKKTD